jgi:hypothetical protein
VCPLRFHLTQQPRYGDTHVYGARSRFFTPRVMLTLRESAAPCQANADGALAAAGTRLDAGARLRDLW